MPVELNHQQKAEMKSQIHQPYTLYCSALSHILYMKIKNNKLQPMGAPIASENMQLSLNTRVVYAGPRVSVVALQDTLWYMSTGQQSTCRSDVKSLTTPYIF